MKADKARSRQAHAEPRRTSPASRTRFVHPLLTPAERVELSDLISPRPLTRQFVIDIENALLLYDSWGRLERHNEHQTRGAVTAARELLRRLPAHPEHDELRTQLRTLLGRWQRPKHRPVNKRARALRVLVVDALKQAGVPIQVTHQRDRTTEAMDVIRLVMRWADEIDRRVPRHRQDVFTDTKTARDLVESLGAVAAVFSTYDTLLDLPPIE